MKLRFIYHEVSHGAYHEAIPEANYEVTLGVDHEDIHESSHEELHWGRKGIKHLPKSFKFLLSLIFFLILTQVFLT